MSKQINSGYFLERYNLSSQLIPNRRLLSCESKHKQEKNHFSKVVTKLVETNLVFFKAKKSIL